jgi:hypothetical protein
VAITEVRYTQKDEHARERTFGKSWKISRLAHTGSLCSPLDSFVKSFNSHCCGLELGYNPLLFDIVNISIEDSKVIAKMFLRIQAKINLRNMPGRVRVVGNLAIA